ncbi:MAG: TlpA family protein disulfide reductase [Anaerolineae bacterium]|nr:TlpA family protein disulfide reductase [Anaerolineae bacterium]
MVSEPEQGKRRRSGLGMGLILVITLSFFGILAYGQVRKGISQPRSGPAPEFTLMLFDGSEVSLADLRGRPVIVNFWASWCDPCKDEAALLESAWRRHKDEGLMILGIDYLDQEPQARAYLEEFHITYPNGPDLGSKIARRYFIRGVPETFFIGPDGQIRYFREGPFTSMEDLEAHIQEIMP